MREQVLKTSIEALKTSHHYIVVTEEKRAATTKGKLKATEQDEEREAEIERKLEQLQIAESELQKELEQSTPDEEVDLAGQSKSSRPPSYASSDQHPALTAAIPAFRDGEPLYNPFTGSYAYRETGFEPGPSEPNRASKGQQDAWMLDYRSEDNIDNGGETAANVLDGAMAETSPDQLSEDEATATRHRSDIATRGVKSEDGDTGRVGKRIFGNIVKLFESWTTLTVQRLFYREKHSASEPSASYTEEKEDVRNQQRQDNEWNLGWQHERQLEQSSSQRMGSVLSPEEENLAKRDQTDVSHKLAIELQTQQDEDETRRQTALVIEQDHMEAMRLQEAFELEDERERQALEFVRGLEEAIRLEEQEAILQAQQRVAISFAQDLEEAERLNQEFRALEEIKQADREYAERLMNELRTPYDRISAQEFEADIGNQTAFEHPVSSAPDEPLSPGLRNIQQTPGAAINRPRSPLILASRQPTKQTIPQVPSAIDSADCGVCGDSLPGTQLLRPCDHYYCRACLAGQYLSSPICCVMLISIFHSLQIGSSVL